MHGMTKTEQMIATLIESIEIIRSKYQDAWDRQDLATGEADALFNEFRAIGETVSSLPSRFKSLYSHAIAWRDLEAWADSSKFSRDEFTLGKLSESWSVLAKAEVGLARHTGSYATMQRDIIVNRDMQTTQLKQELDNLRRTPHIFLWFTAFLIPLRAGLAQIGWEITSWQMAVYLLVIIPLWMMMRENRREYDFHLFYPEKADYFATHTEFYDISLWGRFKNLNQLEVADKNVRKRRRNAERVWILFMAASIAITICVRISPLL